MAKTLVAICSFFSVWAATLAQAEAPAPGQVRIDAVAYHGTGCQPGSVAYNISRDAQAMTLLFSNYLVDSSTRTGRPLRKACDVNVTLEIPAGWSYTVFDVDVRGYASIQAGAVGVQKVFASFGAAPQQIGRLRLVGPFDNDYQTRTSLPVNAVEWSHCNNGRKQQVNLKTAITVRPVNGFGDDDGDVDRGQGTFPFGYMTMDSLDGGIRHLYTLAWKRCLPPGRGMR